MQTSKNGINLIKKYESFVAHIYTCPSGKATIGYGHVVLPTEKFSVITKTEAGVLLAKDIQKFEAYINGQVKVPLSQNQFDALVSFVFNVGPANFITSTLLKKLNAYDYKEASNQILKWVYGTVQGIKTKLPGLIARRKEEQTLFLS